MHVVRHQAVRNQVKLRLACGLQDLRSGPFADREIVEDRFSERRAKCDGVSLQSDVLTPVRRFGRSVIMWEGRKRQA